MKKKKTGGRGIEELHVKFVLKKNYTLTFQYQLLVFQSKELFLEFLLLRGYDMAFLIIRNYK